MKHSLLHFIILALALAGCSLKDIGFIRTKDKDTGTSVTASNLDGRALFTQTTAAVSTTASNGVTYGGACETGATIKVSVSSQGAALRKVATVTCEDGTWSVPVSETTDLRREYQFTQTTTDGRSTTLSAVWWRDTVAPSVTVGSLRANDGATSATNNRLRVSLVATDNLTNVTHFCLRYTSSGTTPPPTPGCWVAVDNPDQPALVPRPTLTLSNYYFRIGYTANTYDLFAYVKDDAGNVSAPRSISLDYAPAAPPVVINVVAANTNTPSSPVALAERTLAAGETVYIKWNAASAVTGLASSPISLYYTTDETTFHEIVSATSNAAHTGCTVDGATYTGCYKWTNGAPVGTYFRIRVAATDLNGMVTFGSSSFINSGNLLSVAGNTDAGLNASGTAGLFFSMAVGANDTDSNSFVVTRDGTVYFRDQTRGILRVAPDTGIQTVLIPMDTTKSGAALGDGGPVSSAYLRFPLKIALDYSDGLLVYDYDRIRRIDLNTSTIQTFIGGGSDDSDGIAPLAVELDVVSTRNRTNGQMPFIPLPNGDLIFQSDQFNTAGARFRYYTASTGLVTSIDPSGGGTTTSPTEDIVTCTTTVAGVIRPCLLADLTAAFDVVSGTLTTLQVGVLHATLGSQTKPFSNLTPTGPSRGATLLPHPPLAASAYSQRISGRDGKIYALDRIYGYVHQFDADSNTWTLILGSGTIGACADGTLATACKIHLADFFVDAQGGKYFVDRGKIRTIDEDNKVVTLYGQSFAFGDGGAATSARFGDIEMIDRTNAGEIVAADYQEFRFRAFTVGGNISTLAGNGNNGQPSLGQDATVNPLDLTSSGQRWDYFRVSPTTGDIYFHSGTRVTKLARATGFWSTVTGSASPTYPPGVIGINGSELLIQTQKYDSDPEVGRLTDSIQKIVTLATGAIANFAGFSNPSVPPSVFCAAGTDLSACQQPTAHAPIMTNASYDAVNGVWLEGLKNVAGIRSLTPGGTLELLTNTTNAILSFAYVRPAADPSQQIVYYCSVTDGHLYQRAVGGAETALPWDAPTVKCAGRSLLYDATRNSLVFVYRQNELLGIAEYRL